MSSDDKVGTLKEHEKFWAFIFLIVAVVALVILASSFGNAKTVSTDLVMQAKLRIIDAAITGLLTISGMAAQALFRISQTDRVNAEAALETAKKAPAPTQPVVIEQPASKPVPTEDVTPLNLKPEQEEGDDSWMRR